MAVYHRTQRLQIYGEKPEVTQLFGGRYRMVVRCKAARDTEAWYNANKDQIFASFGTLYSAQMSVDGIDPRTGEAYPDMCLVSNSASYTQTGEYVITFVYETLTAVWTKEQDDEVTSTDNGLRVLERSEVAKVDGFPIVQLSSPNSSKVVLSGMGNASNYFVLLVKANSANTIYWRATNEALATYTGSFTTANTDQWEYKVIYTPISIDQLEIGYDGTNYSTFDLSEFYLVSQSSDWQNNIVESFIKFEVTVDNPSPFTDTVVFTGSNGNTATGTNVQGGGTGSISSPYDEDDVGVSTIADGGKTLYLASFQDQTGAESNAQVGRVVTRWAEAGVLSVSTNEDSITSEVVVDALNMDAAAVRSAVAAVTANHNLKSQSTNDFEGLQSFRYVFEIRSTTLETELGDTQIGVSFDTGIQTNGSSDFIIQRQYSISSANVASSIKKLIPPEINDPVFDGTGGTQKAYIVDQEVKPNGKDGAVLTRTFAMLPSHLEEWDDMVIRFPGVERGPFQLDEFFSFRSEPYSEAVPIRICRDFYLSNPKRICRPSEFRPVDKNGNRVSVLTEDTVPTADEYIGYVNSGKYLNDRVSIHRWQGDIWERRIVQFKAE
jgi:hypothetical protein